MLTLVILPHQVSEKHNPFNPSRAPNHPLHSTNLGHTRAAPHTPTGPLKAHKLQRQRSRKRRKQEPHKRRARLDLAAALRRVQTTVRNPAPVVVKRVGAVDGAQLGGQHDGADEGEEGGQRVQAHDDHGAGDAVDKGHGEAVDGDEPRDDDDEHGEVDGGCCAAVGVDVGGDDVAD